MANIETRVDRLEELMAKVLRAQQQTEFEIQKTQQEVQKTQMEIRWLKFSMEEMKYNIEVFNQNIEKTVVEMKKDTERFKQSVEKTVAEMKEDTERFKQSVEKTVAEMKEDTERFKQEIKQTVAEMKKDTERFKQSVEKTVVEMKEDTERFKQNAEKTISKMEKDTENLRKDMNKKWGEMANKLGTIVEDIVAPAVSPVISKYFNCEVDDLQIRRRKRDKKTGLKDEFDVIAVSDDCKTVFLVEVKSNPKIEYIDNFKDKKIDKFSKLFPEYKDYKLVPIFASLRLNEDIINYLTKVKIYAMAYREWEYMDLINFGKF